VAPWGRYFLFGVTVNMRECTYDPSEMYLHYEKFVYGGASPQMITFSNFGPTTQNYIYPDLLIGKGNSRIIGNRVMLDYGYNVNVAALTLTLIDAFDEYVPVAEKYIQVNSGMRVRGINRFNFFVKLGYLF